MAKRQSKSQKHSYSNNSKSTQTSKVEGKNSASNNSPSNGTPEGAQAPDKESSGNDPAWYARDPYLARDAGNFYFSYAFGKNYKLNVPANYTVDGTNNVSGDTAVPGIVTLRMKPSFGFNDKSTSPLTVAANSFYGYVRSLNSGKKNYDPSDITMFLIGVANIYSAIVWAERLYAMALTFADQNRFIGDALLIASGISPNSLRYNLANYRMKLNAFINKMSVYAIPKDITYFNKVAFMYRDLFLENGEGNIKDQIYMYIPDGFYMFTRDSDNMTMVDYAYWPYSSNSLASWTDVMAYLEKLALHIFGDEDTSLMSGDMFKVYGDNIIRLTSMDESIPLPLVYDPMVLWQMKNTYSVDVIRCENNEVGDTTPSSRAKTAHSQFSLGTGRTQLGRPGSIFQDSKGILISVERALDSSTASATTYALPNKVSYKIAMDKLLCSDLASPDIGVVLESSRNIISYHDAPTGYTGTESNKGLGWLTCGSFLCVGIQMTENTTGTPNVINMVQYSGFSSTARSNEAMCRFIPTIFKIDVNGSGQVTNCNPCTDVNNFIVLDQNSIVKLHEVALLSLLYVPGIAKIG